MKMYIVLLLFILVKNDSRTYARNINRKPELKENKKIEKSMIPGVQPYHTFDDEVDHTFELKAIKAEFPRLRRRPIFGAPLLPPVVVATGDKAELKNRAVTNRSDDVTNSTTQVHDFGSNASDTSTIAVKSALDSEVVTKRSDDIANSTTKMGDVGSTASAHTSTVSESARNESTNEQAQQPVTPGSTTVTNSIVRSSTGGPERPQMTSSETKLGVQIMKSTGKTDLRSVVKSSTNSVFVAQKSPAAVVISANEQTAKKSGLSDSSLVQVLSVCFVIVILVIIIAFVCFFLWRKRNRQQRAREAKKLPVLGESPSLDEVESRSSRMSTKSDSEPSSSKESTSSSTSKSPKTMTAKKSTSGPSTTRLSESPSRGSTSSKTSQMLAPSSKSSTRSVRNPSSSLGKPSKKQA